MLAQRARDRVGLDGAAPFDLQLGDRQAVRGRDLRPALAELAAVHDDHVVARRRRVCDRGLHRAGAGRRQDQHVLARLKETLQTGLHLGEDRLELRRAVMDDRLRHREEHLGRHGRRPWGQEVFLQHRVIRLGQKKAWTSSYQRPRRTAPEGRTPSWCSTRSPVVRTNAVFESGDGNERSRDCQGDAPRAIVADVILEREPRAS